MKCFLITMLFIGVSIFAYSQTTFPYPKSIQGYKNNFVPFAASKENHTTLATGNNVKSSVNTNVPFYKADMSVLSIIPTLKLWVLPVNIPNPFIKEED